MTARTVPLQQRTAEQFAAQGVNSAQGFTNVPIAAPIENMANTMTPKVIPIIDSPMEAGDQALREEFAAMINAIDAHIALLEHKLDRKIEELIAWRNEGGAPHS